MNDIFAWVWLAMAMAGPIAGAAAPDQPASAPADGKEMTWSAQPRPEGLRRADFALWVPGEIVADRAIRGVLCVSDYQAGRTLYTDPSWRAMAAKLGCAIMMYDLERPASELKLAKDQAAVDAIGAALAHFAAEARRPELAHAPLVLTGLSQSGWQAVAFANLMPDRVAAAVSYHEATPARAPAEGANPAAYAVPMLHVMGGRCFLTPRIYPWVIEARSRGALKTCILQPDVPHHKMGDQAMALLWLEDVFNRRVPDDAAPGKPVKLAAMDASDGWLGVLDLDLPTDRGGRSAVRGARIAPAGDADVDAKAALWLPSERVARAWLVYAQTGSVPTADE